MNKLKELKELLSTYEETQNAISFLEAEYAFCIEKYLEGSDYKFFLNIPKMRIENTALENDILANIQRSYPINSINLYFGIAYTPEEMLQIQDVLMLLLKRKRAKIFTRFTQEFNIEI